MTKTVNTRLEGFEGVTEIALEEAFTIIQEALIAEAEDGTADLSAIDALTADVLSAVQAHGTLPARYTLGVPRGLRTSANAVILERIDLINAFNATAN